MIDPVEIYVHWHAGRSQAQIADSLGLDRKRSASWPKSLTRPRRDTTNRRDLASRR